VELKGLQFIKIWVEFRYEKLFPIKTGSDIIWINFKKRHGFEESIIIESAIALIKMFSDGNRRVRRDSGVRSVLVEAEPKWVLSFSYINFITILTDNNIDNADGITIHIMFNFETVVRDFEGVTGNEDGTGEAPCFTAFFNDMVGIRVLAKEPQKIWGLFISYNKFEIVINNASVIRDKLENGF
jgi:hypothetical protein